MNNKNFIKLFIKTATEEGTQAPAKYSRLGFKNNILINYDTPICYIDKIKKIIFLNIRKYSATTSRIQSRLALEISQADNLKGYKVQEYEGDSCHYWNAGFSGAPTISKQDIDRAAFNFQFQKGGFYNESI